MKESGELAAIPGPPIQVIYYKRTCSVFDVTILVAKSKVRAIAMVRSPSERIFEFQWEEVNLIDLDIPEGVYSLKKQVF